MGLLKSLFVRIVSSIKHYIFTCSNEQFCRYLKRKGVQISGGVVFRYPNHTTIDLSRPSIISIGKNVDINDNFTIMTHDFGTFVFRNLYYDFVPSSGKVTIGNNIYIARDVTILKGVSIGDNCIIGCGSIVTKDIPANSVACGIPAKVVCSIDEYYNKRKDLSINESVEYYIALKKYLGKTPKISDFPEEWALFFREKDYVNYPEMHKIIDWRLKKTYEKYWKHHCPVFDGFESFVAFAEEKIIKK